MHSLVFQLFPGSLPRRKWCHLPETHNPNFQDSSSRSFSGVTLAKLSMGILAILFLSDPQVSNRLKTNPFTTATSLAQQPRGCCRTHIPSAASATALRLADLRRRTALSRLTASLCALRSQLGLGNHPSHRDLQRFDDLAPNHLHKVLAKNDALEAQGRCHKKACSPSEDQ